MINTRKVDHRLNLFIFLFCFIAGFTAIGCNNSSSDNNQVEDNLTGEQFSEDDFLDSGWEKREIANDELLNWKLLGIGKVSKIPGDQICLEEGDNSNGVMLLSPASYEKNIVLKYNILALTPATVFVSVLSAGGLGNDDQLAIPENYDGSMGFWVNQSDNYFFAFKNDTHNSTPYVAKNPSFRMLDSSAVEDKMVAGIYYNVEVGKMGNKLWLKIDGEKLFEATDQEPIDKGGRVSFRFRGTAGQKAIGLIKDVVIYQKP